MKCIALSHGRVTIRAGSITVVYAVQTEDGDFEGDVEISLSGTWTAGSWSIAGGDIPTSAIRTAIASATQTASGKTITAGEVILLP